MSRIVLPLSSIRSLFDGRKRAIFDVLDALATSYPNALTANEIRRWIGYEVRSDYLRTTLLRLTAAGILAKSADRPARFGLRALDLQISLRRGA